MIHSVLQAVKNEKRILKPLKTVAISGKYIRRITNIKIMQTPIQISRFHI